MDYIAEINQFEQKIKTKHISAAAQLLWYKLMNLCCNSGWEEWMEIDNLRLMTEIQTRSETTFIKIRDELIEAGFLTYKKGKKGSPNSYHLISISLYKRNTSGNTPKNEVKNEVYHIETNEKSLENTSNNAVKNPIYNSVVWNTNYNRKSFNNNIYIYNSEYEKSFMKFWEKYPNKQREELAKQAYCELLTTKQATEEELLKAAENYADEVKNTGQNRLYLPNNFLIKRIFKDYLKKKPCSPASATKQGKKNSFNNIEPREYDYEELERKFLGLS